MAKSKVVEKEQVQYKLTALDRCDRCDAQAYVSASGVSGELLFCGHHYNKVKDSIKEWAFEIVDETGKLNENRLTGSAN
jgi:hypothetical protein